MVIKAENLKALGFIVQKLFEIKYPGGLNRDELLGMDCGGWLRVVQDAARRGVI